MTDERIFKLRAGSINPEGRAERAVDAERINGAERVPTGKT
jgi:hypothetical protein